MKHSTHTINDSRTINETIHYKMSDKTKAPNDYQTTVKFSRDGFNDEVTNVDYWNAWQPGNMQKLKAVDSPEVAGYTPDIKQVKAYTVGSDAQDIKTTVTYTPNIQLAHVKYIYDTDHKTLTQDDLSGRTNEISGYRTKDRINEFKAHQYILVSDNYPAKGMTFDNQDNIDQQFEVHFKHATRTDEQYTTVLRTIKYVYQNGQQAQPEYKDDLKFHETKVVDLVDGHTVSDDWTSAQDFKTITTPKVQGYTPDYEQISNTNIKYDHPAVIETVTYNPDAQKAVIKYIDDTNGQQLSAKDLSGYSDQSAGYNTKSMIDKYVAAHYDLVSDDTKGQNVAFDHDDKTDQHYEVHLTHHLTPIKDHQEVKETIHYVYADGAAHTGKAANDYQATPLEFNRTGEHDNVTNTDSWNAWMPGSLSFSKVDSPMIQGYTPDQRSIDVTPVDANSQDIGKTVTYAPNVQKLTVKFIDDTNDNKVLKTVVKTGYSDEKADYNTKADLQALLNRHYDLASDQTKGNDLVFDHDDDIDQTYEVHLTHHLTPIEDHQEVNETIHYVYANGQAVADDHKARLAFHRTGEHDDVTGTDSWNTWIPGSLSFDKIDSPTIQGYTPDKASIDVMPVSAEDKDLEFKITYAPNSQSSHYRFVDDDNKDSNGKPIQVGTDIVKTGNTDQTITYQDGDFPIPAGYELVSELPTKYTFKASGNDPIDIHLKHKIVIVTLDDPKQSTDKLPDNPDKAYPSGLSHDDLNETIKRPITVIKPDDSTIDASQTVTLSRTATIDEVTGKIIKYSDWTTGSFAEYNAPEIPEYTPNRNANAVAEVKHGDHFAPITITYIPINSGTGTDEKPDSNPGDKQPSDHTPEPSKSNTEEVRNVPDKNAIKPREIAKHVTNKVTHSIQIAKSTTKDFKSNVAIHAENLDHRKHKSNVDIDSDIGEAKIQVKGKVNIKDQATNAATKHTLPQTGQKNNDLSLLGLSAAALGMLTALLGTMIDRKRK